MIIFDLEILADGSHRRHFIDPEKDLNYRMCLEDASGKHRRGVWYHDNGSEFKPDYESYYDACHKDETIQSTLTCYDRLNEHEIIEVWTEISESSREKLLKWISQNIYHDNESLQYINRHLKMRPIGDETPWHELKERWANECKDKIDFVFDKDPKSIEMWKRRGVFVFNCEQ